MTTNIGGGKEEVNRSQSRSSSRGQSPGKSSAVSVAWLNEQSLGKMGGITKTTEVNVTGSGEGGGDMEFEDGVKRNEAHMV